MVRCAINRQLTVRSEGLMYFYYMFQIFLSFPLQCAYKQVDSRPSADIVRSRILSGPLSKVREGGASVRGLAAPLTQFLDPVY